MIECIRGYGCLTCFALLSSGRMVLSPLSLDDGALCVRAGYISMYCYCKSFAVLLYNTLGGWIASWVSLL